MNHTSSLSRSSQESQTSSSPLATTELELCCSIFNVESRRVMNWSRGCKTTQLDADGTHHCEVSNMFSISLTPYVWQNLIKTWKHVESTRLMHQSHNCSSSWTGNFNETYSTKRMLLSIGCRRLVSVCGCCDQVSKTFILVCFFYSPRRTASRTYLNIVCCDLLLRSIISGPPLQPDFTVRRRQQGVNALKEPQWIDLISNTDQLQRHSVLYSEEQQCVHRFYSNEMLF
jgi:hypothetical protein